ncbi:hypothetical protein [Runella slithyformis]|uniref:Uncharacterized protein n=1 Tax=Runella slithyformis (strain ATCC 29530 / DSM 19594 / LMG 11500 / NCIMB 11436 / LSU 4) TaxID=761193 RepID=A0A7U3ZJS5_RUNSL|nr:hypothetical protein [Runella slithyformis]AEI48527.1 hypothetical protein Runsl_2113 [Runella slithyformis DSM 19594]
MKKLSFLQNHHLLFCAILAAGLVIQSCKNQIDNSIDAKPATNVSFITFQTHEEYQAAAKKMNKSSYSELEAYQRQHNFISMRMLLL